jgi:hypothetical protein
MTYRGVIYLGTFLTGAVALVFQVAWQRYLTFLVGSEARSISLVVAVFLFGLAAGYRFWGDLSRRLPSRATQVKALGFVELGIALYGLLFPGYFDLVRQLASAAPDAFALDLLWSAMLLLPPTFLMGASIPLLTSAVPVSAGEVNFCHTRIYGINTLGAVLGALAAGLWLVPAYGLAMTLIIGAVLEAAVGITFVLNPLRGGSHQAEDIPRIPNRFGAAGIYLFVFTTGAVSVGLEIIFMRAMALSIGPGTYVFPIVVGVVILGLALGSLSLRRTGLTAARVPREIVTVAAILTVVYFTVPYWPYWISHVHVSLAPIPSNYPVYLFLVVVFTAIMLLPLVIPMGRLLPLGYALIDKTRDDYGKLCGRVYFCNTLGTVAGAIGIGYLLFLVADLPQLFKISIALLLVLSAALAARIPRRRTAVACLAAAAVTFLLPGWDRICHVVGLFRHGTVQPYHFQGLFHLPDRHESLEVLMLRDDPGATISAYEVTSTRPGVSARTYSRTLTVNAKPDGNTVGDYSNMVLSGIVPYLYAPRESGLDTAVVGLGTGMTSGALASMPDVESVTTLEIFPAVIAASRHFDVGNFDLSADPGSQIVQADAFRYFGRTGRRFDVIVSEPSNPWVTGVENLFTPEYYALVSRALAEGGVFFQWIQLYATTEDIFGAICVNVTDAFPHVSLFLIGEADVGILASHAPLASPHLERRMGQAEAQRALRPIGLDDAGLLPLVEIFETAQLRGLAAGSSAPRHSVEYPWIAHAAAKAAFMLQNYDVHGQLMMNVGRHLPASPARQSGFESWMRQHAADLRPWCVPAGRHSTGFLCTRLQRLAADYLEVRAAVTVEGAAAALAGYGRLREEGYLARDLPLLEAIEHTLRESGAAADDPALDSAAIELVRQLSFEWEWDAALRVLSGFIGTGVIDPAEAEVIRAQMDAYRAVAAEWRGTQGPFPEAAPRSER